jgi:hypothetical protein
MPEGRKLAKGLDALASFPCGIGATGSFSDDVRASYIFEVV